MILVGQLISLYKQYFNGKVWKKYEGKCVIDGTCFVTRVEIGKVK